MKMADAETSRNSTAKSWLVMTIFGATTHGRSSRTRGCGGDGSDKYVRTNHNEIASTARFKLWSLHFLKSDCDTFMQMVKYGTKHS